MIFECPICLDNIKYRYDNIKEILLFIKKLKLKSDWIFEYYVSDNEDKIIKICYRIPFKNKQDIILIIGENKQIITIYFNSIDDLHYTLKKELYNYT